MKTTKTKETGLFASFKSITKLMEYFDCEKKCREYIVATCWQGGLKCPYCGCTRVYGRRDGRYTCKDCRSSFSVLVGTIFQGTKLSLIKWFVAIYLLCNNKQGLSSCQLSREIGVTQKTAWFMLQKIRMTLRFPEDGFEDNVRGQIVGIANDDGRKVYARKAERPVELHPEVQRFVRPGTRIYTDEIVCGQTLYDSEREEYRTEDAPDGWTASSGHPLSGRNPGDMLWTQLKRMVVGIYHFVSVSLLHRYVYEELFRRRTCRMSNALRFSCAMEMATVVLPYRVVRPGRETSVA